MMVTTIVLVDFVFLRVRERFGLRLAFNLALALLPLLGYWLWA
ncbi:hypothetical protein [Thermus sp.]